MKKMTEWYPPNKKPVHKGVYETEFSTQYGTVLRGFSLWSGKDWSLQHSTMATGVFLFGPGAEQNKSWRGFTEKQK